MDNIDLEAQLSQQADKIGVSTAKLRAVYQRGVSACMSEGYYEPPVFHGLARVQRFIFALQSKNSRYTLDEDFLPCDYSNLPSDKPAGVETEGEWPLVYELLNSNQLNLFPGETVTSTQYDTETKELTISGDDWQFSYNFSSGDSDLSV